VARCGCRVHRRTSVLVIHFLRRVMHL
jgi:hypothetical protein